MLKLKRMLWLLPVTLYVLGSQAYGQPIQNGQIAIGGFRCVDLATLRNDDSYNLFQLGYWTYASFRMDVWKRHGVPFWYPSIVRNGNIRIAGPLYQRPYNEAIASQRIPGKCHADRQMPGNGAISFVNDGDTKTYWYSGEGRPNAQLWMDFPEPVRINAIRFLGWAAPVHAPKDYSVGIITPDGERKTLRSVSDEKRMGTWINIPANGEMVKGIFLDVRTTIEGKFGPVIYEFQALGESAGSPASLPPIPAQIVIPLAGVTVEQLFCLGHVGSGFDTSPETETSVGEYVLTYTNGQQESIPLIAGRNVADMRYGCFVPEAEAAFILRDCDILDADNARLGSYHLDELLPVEPKKQLLMFEYTLRHGDWPLESLTFRCTNPKTCLMLAALTLRQSGPRMNALHYQGKPVRVYPDNTPAAAPCPLNAMRDRTTELSLDGSWQYQTDPGNRGVRQRFFDPACDVTTWKSMPVPSQWYVQGLDYHGVVWYRREFEVPASFPGSVLELHFGGIDYDARVWVNGEYVGRHTGAYSEFTLDATRHIRRDGKNVIVVRVDSPLDPGYPSVKTLIKGNSMLDIAMPYNGEGCMGGIFRPVTLVGHGGVAIRDPWTVSTVSTDLKQADVAVRLALDPGSSKQAVTVKYTFTEPKVDGSEPRIFKAEKTLQLEGVTPVEISFHIDRPILWYPWEQGQPYLHTLAIEVWEADKLLDRHISHVGIRQVAFNEKESCVYVNHHRIFIKGMLNDDPHWMSLMDRTGYRQRIQLQKDANLNLIRMVGHQSSPDMYDLCDEMGMMIWQEMPLQWEYSPTEPIRKDILNICGETMRQCRPHASVIGWSAWNEGGQADFTKKLTNFMQDLDSTRPMTRACGGGDFDIHIYPNITPPLMSRRTFFWTGMKLGFVSEVGAYGLSSLDEMREIVGPDLFAFGAADYYWETFNTYRYNDGPVFWDAPGSGDWPADKIRDYVIGKLEPSSRWLCQFMKFMYEHMRAQRFAPTTAAIHCRFDDAMPTAFLGVVNFNGRPRAAYQSVRQACQQVLPILFFNYTGIEDVRVINEYWNRAWRGCTLTCTLKDRSGQIIRQLTKTFDLPADSNVPVIRSEELGDVFGLSDGFQAKLQVKKSDGTVLSTNHYDLTGDELRAFFTSVLPPPPVVPYRGILIKATEAAEATGVTQRIAAEGTYGQQLLEFKTPQTRPHLKYKAKVDAAGRHLIRLACNTGETARLFELQVDGRKAEREESPFTNMTLGMTRLPYSAHRLSWYPGWVTTLTPGEHTLELVWPEGKKMPNWLLDALCLQPER